MKRLNDSSDVPVDHEFPFLPVGIPKNSMAGQQRQQISELQIDKFPHTINVFMLEKKIQKPGNYLFRFSLGGYAMDQKSGIG